MSSAGARLAFFGMRDEGETPAPSPARAHVDAAVAGRDEGPASRHRLHGVIPIGPGTELRITSQPARVMENGSTRGARIVIRRWYLRRGLWWTAPHESGITVRATDAHEFALLVGEAALTLACEGEP